MGTLASVDPQWVVVLLCGASAAAAAVALRLVGLRGRSQALLAAFNDSTRGTAMLRRNVGWRGFVAAIEPAPNPFDDFVLRYAVNPPLWLSGLALLGMRTEQIELAGHLAQPPQVELVWQRGRTPGVALGRSDDPTLWKVRRDGQGGEAAVRGADTAAVETGFQELSVRFGPLLEAVTLRAEPDCTLAIRLAADRLNVEDVARLVGLIRLVGRYAIERSENRGVRIERRGGEE